MGSPWVKGVLYLRKRIEGCDYKWVKGILNILTGRQLTIEDLMQKLELSIEPGSGRKGD